MPQATNGPTPDPIAGSLSGDACRAVLERSRFGHLAFAREGIVDVVPIRFASLEGSLYFRADAQMRIDIGHNRWAVISVVDMLEPNLFASVVARGACYATEDTGSSKGDAAALRGIRWLRDCSPGETQRSSRDTGTTIVYRLHVDGLRGSTTVVSNSDCVDSVARPHVHVGLRAESSDDNARANDDGMRQPRPDLPSPDARMAAP